MADSHDPIRIFYCYAPQDRKICDEIETYFKPQIDEKAIEIWASHHISAGENRKQEARKHLLQADIVLVMVSPDFLASDYLVGEEMTLVFKRRQEDKTKIIPILLRPCDLQGSPLGEIEALPDKPITNARNRDRALLSLTKKMREVVEEVRTRKELRKASSLPSSYISSTIGLYNNLTLSDDANLFVVNGIGGRDIEVRLLPQQQKAHLDAPSQLDFCYNVSLPDPGEFFGRVSEWKTLLLRCGDRANTSIIGPHRSGKTWLLERLILEAPDVLGSEYRVGYIDAYSPSCNTVQGFVETVLEALGIRIITPVEQQNMILLEKVLKALAQNMLRFVLCIDRIDKLHNQEEFDTHFFGNLRALERKLILVTASKSNLFEAFGKNNRTSDFFNIFVPCEMKPFTEQEAQNFLSLKGKQAGLTKTEQNMLLSSSQLPSGWYPVRLQLAGTLLRAEKESEMYRNVAWNEYWEGFEQRLNEKYEQIKGPV